MTEHILLNLHNPSLNNHYISIPNLVIFSAVKLKLVPKLDIAILTTIAGFEVLMVDLLRIQYAVMIFS